MTASAAVDFRIEARRALAPAWLRGLGIQVVIWGAFIGLWQAGATWVSGAETLIGSPADVVNQIVGWLPDPIFWSSVAQTAKSALIGFGVGVGVACLAVALTWPFRLVREFLSPFLIVVNAIPRVALAPLFILWFGIGTTSSALFVASLVFLIVYLNVFTGLSSIDVVYVHNAKILGARRAWLIGSVYIPAVANWLLTSLRLAVVWGVLGAALAEYLAGSTGLGAYLSRGNILGDPAMLVGSATVIAVISLLADRSLSLVERRYTQWRLF